MLPLSSWVSTAAPSLSHADQVPMPQAERSTSPEDARPWSPSTASVSPGNWSSVTSPVGAVYSMCHHCGFAR